jgi:hypothetical protein
MLHYLYEEIKKEIDLDIYYEPPKETKSDEVFAIFHPGLNVKLSDILEGTDGFDTQGFLGYLKTNYDPRELARKKIELDNEYLRDMNNFARSSTTSESSHGFSKYQGDSKESQQ